MKRNSTLIYAMALPVTSHAEVWIETIIVRNGTKKALVTSHAEVWIETQTMQTLGHRTLVTSHAEVWIETMELLEECQEKRCHLPRGGVD